MGLLIFLTVPIALITLRSIVIVPQNHIGLAEMFGKFRRTLPPGLHLVIPFLEYVPAKIDLAIRNFFFDMEAVTQDKVKVKIKANLIYKIDRDHVTEYYYNLTDPERTLASFVENYSRSYVASQTHEELLERREEMTEYLLEHLQERMRQWGIDIIGFQITDIVFPKEITDAMSKVVASQRLKEAAQNEAEANKIKLVKQAEAEKEARILLGEGVAGERQAIIDGLKHSIEDMKKLKDFNPTEIMNLIVISQYFDTIKDIAKSNNTKVMFINPAPKGASDMIQQLASAIESTNDRSIAEGTKK